MTFNEALVIAGKGKNIGRESWNNKFLFIVERNKINNSIFNYLCKYNTDKLLVSSNNGKLGFKVRLDQEDLFSNDWKEV